MTYLQSLPIRIIAIPAILVALCFVQVVLLLIVILLPIICLMGDITQGKKLISKGILK